ncbi:hypothetical protein [Providencia phage PSTRCR_127]|nr:hypothetical protein [Providencia phage PSTRCR_127]
MKPIKIVEALSVEHEDIKKEHRHARRVKKFLLNKECSILAL